MAKGPKLVPEAFGKVYDEVMKPRRRNRWSCANDTNSAEYTMVNGQEVENLCAHCLSESLFEFVTNADHVISFGVECGKKPIKQEITIL